MSVARIVVRQKNNKLYWSCSLCGDYKKQITYKDSNRPECNYCDSCGNKFTK